MLPVALVPRDGHTGGSESERERTRARERERERGERERESCGGGVGGRVGRRTRVVEDGDIIGVVEQGDGRVLGVTDDDNDLSSKMIKGGGSGHFLDVATRLDHRQTTPVPRQCGGGTHSRTSMSPISQ